MSMHGSNVSGNYKKSEIVEKNGQQEQIQLEHKKHNTFINHYFNVLEGNNLREFTVRTNYFLGRMTYAIP